MHHTDQSNKNRVKELVKQFGLKPHPEGGYYLETYRSEQQIETKNGNRNIATAIYFLIEEGNVSNFHRIKSDEHWFFHEGSPLEIHVLSPENGHETLLLGNNFVNGERPHQVVPAQAIFGSCVHESGYSFVSCVVSPGFDFQDFELFKKEELLNDYPKHEAIINKLTP